MRRKQIKMKTDGRKVNYVDIEKYKPPFTMAGVPEDKQKVLDSCFTPVATMLDHAFEGLASEGVPMFVGYGVLTGLAQNGLVRAGVNMRADEMTRMWGAFVRAGEQDDIKIESDDKDEKLQKLEERAKILKVQDFFNRAARYCGYYGGCLGYIETGDTDLANPLILDKATFTQGSFKGLKLVEPFTCTPGYYNSTNPLADDYFKPSLWYVQGVAVHESRFLYFTENEVPTILRPSYNFFGLSLAQTVLDAVSHYTDCREQANRLLKKYATTVFKTDMDNVLSGGMDNMLQNRIQYFVQNRDNDGCAAIDKEREDLVIMTTSLSGVTDVVRQAMEYVAAMFNEPVTKMWGISPAGFNTGDADLRNHYDNIASLQAKMFSEPMQRLCRVMQMDLFGETDNSISFEFAPLGIDDEQVKANTNKIQADTDSVLIDAGIITPEESRQRLIEDKDSGYNNLIPYDEPNMGTKAPEPFDPTEDPAAMPEGTL